MHPLHCAKQRMFPRCLPHLDAQEIVHIKTLVREMRKNANIVGYDQVQGTHQDLSNQSSQKLILDDVLGLSTEYFFFRLKCYALFPFMDGETMLLDLH